MTAISTLNWPEPPAGGPIGDGRFAYATIRPNSPEALCEAVRQYVAEGHAIYPRGGGTKDDLGGPPRRPGIAIDTRDLQRVIDYPHADMTITVQAGITLAALRTILAGENQRLLIDAPMPDRATLGGVFATNSCGSRRFGLGRPRDQIIGISFVTSEGVEVKGGGRVVKNVAGYDLPKLLTGSLGTLGIIDQLTLKVRPLPECSAIAWAPLAAPSLLESRLSTLNLSAARPVAVDVLNPAAARQVADGLDLPTDRWVIVVGLEDNEPSVRWQIVRLGEELGSHELIVRQGADAGSIWDRLTQFQAGPASLHATANIRPSAVAGFVQALDPARWAVQSHAGNGIIHLSSLGQWTLEDATSEIRVHRKKAVSEGGNLIIRRCPTDWKATLKVWGEPRPDWALAERVKRAIDPSLSLNPGRFVGGI